MSRKQQDAFLLKIYRDKRIEYIFCFQVALSNRKISLTNVSSFVGLILSYLKMSFQINIILLLIGLNLSRNTCKRVTKHVSCLSKNNSYVN